MAETSVKPVSRPKIVVFKPVQRQKLISMLTEHIPYETDSTCRGAMRRLLHVLNSGDIGIIR